MATTVAPLAAAATAIAIVEATEVGPSIDHDAIPIAALVDDRPTYRVDWWIKASKSTFFSKAASWKWCQVVILGQTLTVFHKDGIVGSFATPTSVLAPNGHQLYVLSGRNGVQLELHCPSNTAIQKLVAVFGASQASAHWTLPSSSSVLDELVDVAKLIVEGANATPKKRAVVPTKSAATIAQVQAFMNRLQAVYTDVSDVAASKEELYRAVLKLEAEYKANPSTPSPLVALVLDVYPDLSIESMAFQLPITECPVCTTHLHSTQTLDIHVGGKMLHCRYCHTVMSYETFQLADLVKNHLPKTIEFEVGMFGKSKHVLPMPGIPGDGKIKTYMETLWSTLTSFSTKGGDKCPRNVYSDIMAHIKQVLCRTDLVQHMYRQLLFVSHIVGHIEYWTVPIVIEASIRRFEQFHYLAHHVVQVATGVASIDIVLVAQTLQVHNQGSAALPRQLVLPRDHGSRMLKVRLAETAVLFHEAYGEPYSPSVMLDQALWLSTKVFVQSEMTRWERAHIQVASHDSQFRGVQQVYPAGRLRHAADLADRPDAHEVAVAVIGAFEHDVRVGNGSKLRLALPEDPSILYDIPGVQRHMTQFTALLR
ncbi:hypothetical protein DYB32_002518 [Aphanomyces invadans]|uniref:Uncharacterized protein n=1 Tax=Aphanomyces invadans TaxID=157072 RepID=A0A3R6VEI9_9STRA|nr:hypothetical protein DYB32_002518 [Aphanomyces invadans]